MPSSTQCLPLFSDTCRSHSYNYAYYYLPTWRRTPWYQDTRCHSAGVKKLNLYIYIYIYTHIRAVRSDVQLHNEGNLISCGFQERQCCGLHCVFAAYRPFDLY